MEGDEAMRMGDKTMRVLLFLVILFGCILIACLLSYGVMIKLREIL